MAITEMRPEYPETEMLIISGKRVYLRFSPHAEYIDDFQMLIKDSRIAATGPADQLQLRKRYPEAPAADLGSGIVVPGFIDMHVHLFLNPDDNADVRNLYDDVSSSCYSQVSLTGMNGISAEACAQAVMRAEKRAQLLLAQGITACRDLGAPFGMNNAFAGADLKHSTIPRIISSGTPLCITGGHGCDISIPCDSPQEFVRAVRRVRAEGVDLVKLMVTGGVNSSGPEPGPMEMSAEEIRAAADTAHMLGLKTAVHAHGASGIHASVLAGVDSIEHGVFLRDDTADIMAEKRIFLVPTLSAPYYAVHQGLREDPDNDDHKKSLEVMDHHKKSLLKAFSMGVPIASGSDSGTPFNSHKNALQELVFMCRAGMPEEAVLASATSQAAELLGMDAHIGTLEKGKYADFAVLKEDPLEDIEHIRNAEEVRLGGRRVFLRRNSQ